MGASGSGAGEGRNTPGAERSAAFVDWTVRHGRWLWVAAVALFVPAAAAMASLYVNLKSDLEELLPPDAPSVIASRELRERMPGLGTLGVVVDSGSTANLPAAERLLDDLAARVRTYPRPLVVDVRTSVEEAHRFVEQHAPLYVDLADLKTISERIAERKSWEAKQRFGALLMDEPEPRLDFSDIRRKYDARVDEAEPLPKGRFSRPDLHLTVLLVQTDSSSAHAARELLSRVRRDIHELLAVPGRYAPGMRIGFAGSVPTAVEELAALAADLKVSSMLVVAAVLTVLLLFFRWWRAIPALLAPLGIATALSFAAAFLLGVHRLNSSTAFLGSIVVGNGVNVGVILVARYVEARRHGLEVRPALVTAVAGARVGTLVAALAAATAYASLTISHFRGFRQFGILGAVGMLLCWACAFVLTPPLLAWLDRGAETAPRPRRNRLDVMAKLAAIIARRPAMISAVAMLLVVAAVAELSRFDTSRIETNFSHLRRRDTWTSGEAFWSRKMGMVLGSAPAAMIMLCDDRTQARHLAAELQRRKQTPPLDELVGRIRTADDVVPPEQPEKLAVVERIRRQLTPAIREQLTPEQRSLIDRFLGSTRLRPFTAAEVPQELKTGLQERDGTMGRVFVVYALPGRTVWEANRMQQLVGSLRRVAAEGVAGGRPARVAGGITVTADIVRSFRHDGPLASLVALLCVTLVVSLAFRGQRSAPFAIGSLAVGVLWMAALDMALGVKLNYTNFIAFPITFGIGVDYAANVMARYRQEGGRDIRPAVAATGGAVALCSATTILGYSSLLLATNRGLFLFGFVAVSGEICCLLAAVVALPAVLATAGQLRETWHARQRSAQT